MGRAPFSFNVSHSGDLVLFGFSGYGSTGVDVEHIRPVDDYESIAQTWFHPDEKRWLHGISPAGKQAAFFDLWTRKEAYVKAMGDGLSRSLDSFSVCGKGMPVFEVEDLEKQGEGTSIGFSLNHWPAYAAAVVVA